MKFRWEEDLRTSFLNHATPKLWCAARRVHWVRSVKESTCSDGRADWVWANIVAPSNQSPQILSGLFEQPACSRILAALRCNAPLGIAGLLMRSGVASRTFRRHLDALIELELVCKDRDDAFSLGPAFRLPKMEICSFEFKLEHWRRALQQAKRYRSFSHRVYVVMPRHAANRALNRAEAFQTFNVGLISHDPGGQSERLILSRKSTPSSPSHFLQAVGLLLRQEDAIPTLRPNSDKARPQLGKCSLPVNRSNSTPRRSKTA